MKRYGDFITSEEELAFLATVRNYVEKEIMPVRMQLDEDYAVLKGSMRVSSNSASRSGVFRPITVDWGSARDPRCVPSRKRFRGATAEYPSTR